MKSWFLGECYNMSSVASKSSSEFIFKELITLYVLYVLLLYDLSNVIGTLTHIPVHIDYIRSFKLG